MLISWVKIHPQKTNQINLTRLGLFWLFQSKFGWFSFITYNTNYIGSIHFLKTIFVRILKYENLSLIKKKKSQNLENFLN